MSEAKGDQGEDEVEGALDESASSSTCKTHLHGAPDQGTSRILLSGPEESGIGHESRNDWRLEESEQEPHGEHLVVRVTAHRP